MENICMFCNFILRKSKIHEIISEKYKGTEYPVIPIFETKTVYSFLSIPDNNEETHLLIIPKQHYEFLEDVPRELSKDLIEEVSNASGILRKKYGACHVLLNNGKGADQYIPHVHFHLIPKSEDKKIIWKDLSVEEFVKISGELKKEFER